MIKVAFWVRTYIISASKSHFVDLRSCIRKEVKGAPLQCQQACPPCRQAVWKGQSLWVRVRFGQDRQLLLLLLQEEGAFSGLSLMDQHDIRCMIREREVASANLSQPTLTPLHFHSQGMDKTKQAWHVTYGWPKAPLTTAYNWCWPSPRLSIQSCNPAIYSQVNTAKK